MGRKEEAGFIAPPFPSSWVQGGKQESIVARGPLPAWPRWSDPKIDPFLDSVSHIPSQFICTADYVGFSFNLLLPSDSI